MPFHDLVRYACVPINHLGPGSLLRHDDDVLAILTYVLLD
jgi:hypothetical protein